MKNLIVFMSHHGTVAKVASELQHDLGVNDTKLVDLGVEDAPDLAEFDTVIIGGSIHIGNIQSKIHRYCHHNEQALLGKRLGLFLCYMDEEHGQEEFDGAYPESLRSHAAAKGLFGGELLFDRMNFLEKLMVRAKTGVKASVSALNEGAIESFTDKMKQ